MTDRQDEDVYETAAWEAAKRAAGARPDPALAPLARRANYVLAHRPGGALYVTRVEWDMLHRLFPPPPPLSWVPHPGRLPAMGPPTFYGVPVVVDHLLADHQARAAARWATGEPVYRYAVPVRVTAELMADAAPISAMIEDAMDRMLCPWRYPDPNPMPRLVLFPRLARLHRRLA